MAISAINRINAFSQYRSNSNAITTRTTTQQTATSDSNSTTNTDTVTISAEAREILSQLQTISQRSNAPQLIIPGTSIASVQADEDSSPPHAPEQSPSNTASDIAQTGVAVLGQANQSEQSTLSLLMG